MASKTDIIATAANYQLRRMVNRSRSEKGLPLIESEYAPIWDEVIAYRKKWGLYAGDDWVEREDAAGDNIREMPADQFRSIIQRMRDAGQTAIEHIKTAQSVKFITFAVVEPEQPLPEPPPPPPPPPQLQPVSWLYSKGDPHGGLLLKDQYDNRYCAYGPLWGISQIGAWSQHPTAPNPPMNDSVLKQISGPFEVNDQLPERLK